MRRHSNFRSRAPFYFLISALLFVGILLFSCIPAYAAFCAPDTFRVFADVPTNHPLCQEIEDLYRDGITTGCAVDADGTRYFCPDEPATRAVAASFSQHRDPFAQVERDGRLSINDHVVNSDRVQEGEYYVQFSRNLIGCSIESWSQSLISDSLEIRARRLFPTIDVMHVSTKLHGQPIDLAFNLRLHCK